MLGPEIDALGNTVHTWEKGEGEGRGEMRVMVAKIKYSSSFRY